MSESFVELGYRGLPLGRRVKLTQVRPSTGYLEVPQPMPVGTPISIATDEGVTFEATIEEIHEQVGGAEQPPGMRVRPRLDTGAATAWWKTRVELPELEKPAPPPPVAAAKTVLPKRMTLRGAAAVPELVDDGQNTAVMDAVDPEKLAKARPTAEHAAPPAPAATPAATPAADEPPLADDGKRTVAMDAVDLAALGLDPATTTGQMAAVTGDEGGEGGEGEATGNGTDPGSGRSPEPKGVKRRRKRR